MVLKEAAKQPYSTLFLSNQTGGLGIQTFLYQAIKAITLQEEAHHRLSRIPEYRF
jgi:hypothetical protein